MNVIGGKVMGRMADYFIGDGKNAMELERMFVENGLGGDYRREPLCWWVIRCGT